eukprot:CAMPEP_0197002190 /NCGR_PEP_ID=MMETSP1380-20130617/6728_1 /TAXON_ID=5936 /ORGANISM="Euplotes crassus, Strain CT5" /LENGTH=352 /DNA_ID=CAMNT_0042420197 /DNA_START=127 /DNA_END=1186 /DNA_ORIENTATION=+
MYEWQARNGIEKHAQRFKGKKKSGLRLNKRRFKVKMPDIFQKKRLLSPKPRPMSPLHKDLKSLHKIIKETFKEVDSFDFKEYSRVGRREIIRKQNEIGLKSFDATRVNSEQDSQELQMNKSHGSSNILKNIRDKLKSKKLKNKKSETRNVHFNISFDQRSLRSSEDLDVCRDDADFRTLKTPISLDQFQNSIATPSEMRTKGKSMERKSKFKFNILNGDIEDKKVMLRRKRLLANSKSFSENVQDLSNKHNNIDQGTYEGRPNPYKDKTLRQIINTRLRITSKINAKNQIVQEKLKKIADETSKNLSLDIQYKLKSKIGDICQLMQQSKLGKTQKSYLTKKQRYPYTLLYDR